ISTLLFFRFVYRAEKQPEKISNQIERMNLIVENPQLENLPVEKIPGLDGVVISRIKKQGAEVQTVTEQTVLNRGDVLLAVGPRAALEKLRDFIGRESGINLLQMPGKI